MRVLRYAFVVLVAGCSFLSGVQAAEVKKMGDGIYYGDLKLITYVVDTVAEACYVAPAGAMCTSGLATVPCASLAKRPEWKHVISWEK